MPRKAVYVLLTKSGPSEADQLAFIKRVIDVGVRDEVYTDDVTDRRKHGAEFHSRSTMLRQLRTGDRVVIATPGRLGVGREDIRGVLHELHRRGVPLIDASTGKELVWTDEVADALQFFERAAMEHKRNAAAGARAALKNMGFAPAIAAKTEKELKVPDDQARIMWLDRARYPSGVKVAELCGVTQRTMYTRFGKRTLEPTPKKLTASMRVPDGRNYLYVMVRRDGLHKVGFSIDPLSRRRQLQQEVKQPVRLVHYLLRPGDARALESQAHFYLKASHRGGEWFEVDLDGAKKGIDMALTRLDVLDFQARRRAIVETAEKEVGRQLSRPEITALMKAMETRDETDAE